MKEAINLIICGYILSSYGLTLTSFFAYKKVNPFAAIIFWILSPIACPFIFKIK
jgi:hypothetical protein